MTKNELVQAVTAGTLPDCMASFMPKVGDAVMVRAGTVHSLREIVVFELQENSDTTYRLYAASEDALKSIGNKIFVAEKAALSVFGN
jgi:mannose-6-phosphate isomerase class I